MSIIDTLSTWLKGNSAQATPDQTVLPLPAPPTPYPGPELSAWETWTKLAALREGRRFIVYRDSLGHPTGGIGHLIMPDDKLNVGDVIPQATVDAWWQKDGHTAFVQAASQCAEAGITSMAFLPYLASVCYQLGGGWTKKFPSTWQLICHGLYEDAARGLTATLWNHQTPVRVADFQTALRALPPKPTA